MDQSFEEELVAKASSAIPARLRSWSVSTVRSCLASPEPMPQILRTQIANQ